MKNKFEEKTMELSQVVVEAYETLLALGDEMQEAFDNTPESLQSSAVGEARQEAADALSSLNRPTVVEHLEAIKVKVHVPVRSPSAQSRLSRSDRRDDAISMLQSAVDALQDKTEYSDVDALLEELDQLISEAEAVEFPGRNA